MLYCHVVNLTTKIIDPKYSYSFTGRESLRDTVSLQSPSGRYSPVRRASDGCSPVSHVRNQLDRMFYQTISGHQTTSDSFKAVLQEYQQLQVLYFYNRILKKFVISLEVKFIPKPFKISACDLLGSEVLIDITYG